MLKNIQEIKQFIEWAKENKVKSFKSGDIEFEISELAMIPGEEENQARIKSLLESTETITDTDPEANEDDEEALYWSTN